MSDGAEKPSEDGEQKPDHKPAKRDYTVGYGKPPKATQFKPGRSGNVRGRRRNEAGGLDIGDILDKPVEVSSNGTRKTMEPRQIALLAQIKKARGGSLQALAHVIDKFVRYGVLGTRKETLQGGALIVPSTMPFAMAQIMTLRFGRPPWAKLQVEKGRAQYLDTRSEQQVREDDAIGYQHL